MFDEMKSLTEQQIALGLKKFPDEIRPLIKALEMNALSNALIVDQMTGNSVFTAEDQIAALESIKQNTLSARQEKSLFKTILEGFR